MTGQGIGHHGWQVAAALAAAAAMAAGQMRGVVADLVSVQVPAGVALPDGTAAMDLALRSTLAGQVAAPAARRPWSVEYGSVALPIAVPNQQASRWCWVASVGAVASYYGRPASQCQLVVAGSPVGALTGGCPDVPGTLGQAADALRETGVPALVVERALSPIEVRTQVDAGRPVLLFLAGRSALVGHVVLVRGYDAAGGLLLGDPVGDRPDASLAWHTTPEAGVPYDALVPAPAADESDAVRTLVVGQGADGTWRFEQVGRWSASVLVAPPGQSPTLTPTTVGRWSGAGAS